MTHGFVAGGGRPGGHYGATIGRACASPVRVSGGIPAYALAEERPARRPAFALERQERRRMPLWLADLLCRARGRALPGETPAVILHETSMAVDEDLVVVRRRDLEALVGPLRGQEVSA